MMRPAFRVSILVVLVSTVLLLLYHLHYNPRGDQNSFLSIPSPSPSPSKFSSVLADDFEPIGPELRIEPTAIHEPISYENTLSEGHVDESPKLNASPKADRVVVMPAMNADDVSWLEVELLDWQHAVYRVEAPEGEFQISQNKGKESNVYLQYITDHYDNLPQYMVFMHSHRTGWHVEFEDNALTVQRLQLSFLSKTGFVNLRCNWGPGCPDEIHPLRQLGGRYQDLAFAEAWMQIFNNTEIPEVVAAPCCAQFAVTREQVLARPLSDYQSYHKWLLETELHDEISGRIFEYMWHIIFGRDPVFCPEMWQCYNDVFATQEVPPEPEES